MSAPGNFGLARITAAHLEAFRSAHPAGIIKPGRDAATFTAAVDIRAAGLALDMVVEAEEDGRLLVGPLPEDGEVYVLILCRLTGGAGD